MTKPTKVAVVGVSRFGRHHALVYRELPDAELVAVFYTRPVWADGASIMIVGNAPLLEVAPEPSDKGMEPAETVKSEGI